MDLKRYKIKKDFLHLSIKLFILALAKFIKQNKEGKFASAITNKKVQYIPLVFGQNTFAFMLLFINKQLFKC
jgi:hypothetical protein